ncbi:MAG: 4-hydroxy-3-methylbut-2-enyl diphosphate reductase [Clostridia bacterium]|nr:4-hydroxy-3-methylbut-2-enyl diphosphate reductase [Clostridia bacterium]
MICYVSQYAGFCFGVSLAVDAAYESYSSGACMLGEVVHNPSVVRDLESRGMRRVSDPEQIRPGEKALIRAHGVGEDVINRLRDLSIPVIDRTCPKVKRIHDIVRRATASGNRVVIAGNRSHPEVIGTMGWCAGAVVLETTSDAQEYAEAHSSEGAEICLVSQTTFNKKKYGEIRDILEAGGVKLIYHDTICLDTSDRQRETSEYSKKVDCVIIVGGMNSSNSTKLYEIARSNCKAMHVESAYGMDIGEVVRLNAVFITGGASTPIENVALAVDTLKNACREAGVPFELYAQGRAALFFEPVALR